jgi:hypothetical protein
MPAVPLCLCLRLFCRGTTHKTVILALGARLGAVWALYLLNLFILRHFVAAYIDRLGPGGSDKSNPSLKFVMAITVKVGTRRY